MKKLSFQELNGWPLSSEALQYLQQMMEQVEGISFIGGQSYILKGCELVGSNVLPGVVVLNGEVLPFTGGSVGDYMIPSEQVTQKAFFGDVQKPFYLDRVAVFGTGSGQVAWASMKRNDPANSILSRLEKLEKIAAPFSSQGGMVLWKKPANEIPAGWQEVVDWRGRLPMGYNPDDIALGGIGAIGGNKTHTLSTGNLPNITIALPGQRGGDNNDNSNTTRLAGGDKSVGETGFNFDLPMTVLGGYTPVNHLNPYRIVMFIEFVG